MIQISTSFRGARSANYDVQSHIGESRAITSGFHNAQLRIGVRGPRPRPGM